ncbi:NAD(P)-binding domain-containing protein [Gordonia zhaorongruii]|uniref:NAD(P)-binding domain-containing protein n=1 Tax=Gordonia zhaorongruii TaxID=2597659 RepID=UPI00140553E2|nr:NAD(P)-binding domain-containing protein [Gordonia zhaorongruii]
MHIGIIGADPAGSNLAHRLSDDGHRIVSLDPHPGSDWAHARSASELVAVLPRPRTIWLTGSAAATGAVIDELAALLGVDDVIVDAGSSSFRDDVTRSRELAADGIHHVDVGVLDLGTLDADSRLRLTVGGLPAIIRRLEPALGTLTGDEYLHCGSAGSGHFVAMVHAGVAEGRITAAEGRSILENGAIGAQDDWPEAGAADLQEKVRYALDVAAITELRQRSSATPDGGEPAPRSRAAAI